MAASGKSASPSRARLVKLAACLLAGLLALAPIAALADEPAIGEAAPRPVAEAPDGGAPGDAAPLVDEALDGGASDGAVSASDVVTLTLVEGTRDFDRAQGAVDAINRLRSEAAEPLPALVVDGDLQETAFQRAAETALWQSATRPMGGQVDGAAELRFHGDGAEPAAVVDALAQAGGDLLGEDLSSVGVGCWEQGGERFYVVLLGSGRADATGVVAEGTLPWSPEVRVDMSGRTSPLLLGRLQASGYRTNLSMVPESTRAVQFSWVTAPDEASAASDADLPVVAIDPSSFHWTSSDPAVASVSPVGVITMRGTSILTPASSQEAGADITVSLDGTSRALSFHVSAAVPVYRLYNAANGAHLYTTDANEYRVLPSMGWTPEGEKWQAVWSSDEDGELTGTPVYRLLNPTNGDHHYTTDSNEYRALPGYGWRQEGIAYYSSGALDGEPVYRIYNGYQTANGGLGSHLWTQSANEYETLAAGGWTKEGASIYGVRP